MFSKPIRIIGVVGILLSVMSVSLAGPPKDATDIVETGAFQAEYRESVSDIAIIELTGDYTIGLDEPRSLVAKEFYKHHQDDYDFIVVFTGFEFDSGDAFAFHHPLKNDVSGIGKNIFDYTSQYGSNGRLLGYTDMAALTRHETSPLRPEFMSTMGTLAHELLHQWGVHIRFDDGTGVPNTSLIGKDGAHWSALVSTDASLEYGANWFHSHDDHYVAKEVRERFSDLDLYLMGLLPPEKVSPTTLLHSHDVDPAGIPHAGMSIHASTEEVSIDQIIAVEGEREPSYQDAQKRFNIAYVYVVSPTAVVPENDIAKIARVRKYFARYFSILTRGEASIGQTSTHADLIQPGESQFVVVDTVANGASSIGGAYDWLVSNQAADGSFGDSEATQYRDTLAAYLAIKDNPAYESEALLAHQWLQIALTKNTDYLSRALWAGLGNSLAERTLTSRRNDDKGWGLDAGYESDPIDTALALLALEFNPNGTGDSYQYKNADYLRNCQNDDGGWGAVCGGESSLTATALALQALHLVDFNLRESDQSLVRTSVDNAKNWILARKLASGAFQGMEHALAESADVLAALANTTDDPNLNLTQSAAYLTANQSEDNSWQGSIYTTATVLNAISAVSNVNLYPLNLVLDSTRFIPGVPIQVDFAIQNGTQAVSASTAQVRLLDDAGVTIVSESIAISALDSGQIIEGSLILPTELAAGDMSLSLVVDAANDIDEDAEYDNELSTPLSFEAIPDAPELSFSASEWIVSPEEISSLPANVSVSALLRNVGMMGAQNVSIGLYRDDEPNPLVETHVNIDAQSSIPVELDVQITSPTPFVLKLWADVEGEITETYNDNNVLEQSISIAHTTDLALVDDSLVALSSTLTPNALGEFEVDLQNAGTTSLPLSTIVVDVLQNDDIVLTQTFQRQPEIAQTEKLPFSWLPLSTGDYQVRVSIDPDNQLPESDETNNVLEIPVTVESGYAQPNLSISSLSISTDPSPVRKGQSAVINVDVRNTGTDATGAFSVQFYNGDPDASGIAISDEITVPTIAGLGNHTVQGIWTDVDVVGQLVLFAVVDTQGQVTEFDETDNKAFLITESQDFPDLILSDLMVSPSNPKPGESVTVSVNFNNTGGQPVSNVLWEVRLSDANGDENVVASSHVLNAAPFSISDVSVSFDAPQSSGAYQLIAAADPANAVVEVSDDNNIVAGSLAVNSKPFYVRPRYFSPNGDGSKDSAQFYFDFASANALRMEVSVVNSVNFEVYRTELDSESGQFNWDGKKSDGVVAPDGTYTINFYADGAVVGTDTLVLDNNRASIMSEFESETGFRTGYKNLTCDLRDVGPIQISADEEHWYTYSTSNDRWNASEEYTPGIFRIYPDSGDYDLMWEPRYSFKLAEVQEEVYFDYPPIMHSDGERIAFATGAITPYGYDFHNQINYDDDETNDIPAYANHFLIYNTALPESDTAATINLDHCGYNQGDYGYQYLKSWTQDEYIFRHYAGHESYFENCPMVSQGQFERHFWFIGTHVSFAQSAQEFSSPWNSPRDFTNQRYLQQSVDHRFILAREDFIDTGYNHYTLLDTKLDTAVMLPTANDIRNVSRATISPIGDKILYAANGHDGSSIYGAMDLSGNDLFRWDNSQYPNIYPASDKWDSHRAGWSHNGREFAWLSQGSIKVLDTSTWETSTAFESSAESNSYHISFWNGQGWENVDVLHFGTHYGSQTVDLSQHVPEASSSIKLRIQHQGSVHGTLDAVKVVNGLDGIAASSAIVLESGNDISQHVAAADNFIVQMPNQTIELDWENIDVVSPIIEIVAQEDNLQTADVVPMHYPQRRSLHFDYSFGQNTQTIIVDGQPDAVALPHLFSELSLPGSGHPSATVRGYVSNDDNYLYAALDFAIDNTWDPEIDWAAIKIKGLDDWQQFIVTADNAEFGTVGFTNTEIAAYPHKYYEFKIPLSSLGNSSTTTFNIQFEAYGSAGTTEETMPTSCYGEIFWVANERTIICLERTIRDSFAVLLDQGGRVLRIFDDFPGDRARSRGLRSLPQTPGLIFDSFLDTQNIDSACYDKGWSDQYLWQPKNNLHADLRVFASPNENGVKIKGSANDINFSHYTIEYASVSDPSVWRPIQPASYSPVIEADMAFWFPPEPGQFIVRLTVHDKAGSASHIERRIGWAKEVTISDIQLVDKYLSPNGDGIKETVELTYDVHSPVQLPIQIRTVDGEVVYSGLIEHAQVDITANWNWDGRNNDGVIVADGEYYIEFNGAKFDIVVDTVFPVLRYNKRPLVEAVVVTACSENALVAAGVAEFEARSVYQRFPTRMLIDIEERHYDPNSWKVFIGGEYDEAIQITEGLPEYIRSIELRRGFGRHITLGEKGGIDVRLELADLAGNTLIVDESFSDDEVRITSTGFKWDDTVYTASNIVSELVDYYYATIGQLTSGERVDTSLVHNGQWGADGLETVFKTAADSYAQKFNFSTQLRESTPIAPFDYWDVAVGTTGSYRTTLHEPEPERCESIIESSEHPRGELYDENAVVLTVNESYGKAITQLNVYGSFYEEGNHIQVLLPYKLENTDKYKARRCNDCLSDQLNDIEPGSVYYVIVDVSSMPTVFDISMDVTYEDSKELTSNIAKFSKASNFEPGQFGVVLTNARTLGDKSIDVYLSGLLDDSLNLGYDVEKLALYEKIGSSSEVLLSQVFNPLIEPVSGTAIATMDINLINGCGNKDFIVKAILVDISNQERIQFEVNIDGTLIQCGGIRAKPSYLDLATGEDVSEAVTCDQTNLNLSIGLFEDKGESSFRLIEAPYFDVYDLAPGVGYESIAGIFSGPLYTAQVEFSPAEDNTAFYRARSERVGVVQEKIVAGYASNAFPEFSMTSPVNQQSFCVEKVDYRDSKGELRTQLAIPVEATIDSIHGYGYQLSGNSIEAIQAGEHDDLKSLYFDNSQQSLTEEGAPIYEYRSGSDDPTKVPQYYPPVSIQYANTFDEEQLRTELAIQKNNIQRSFAVAVNGVIGAIPVAEGEVTKNITLELTSPMGERQCQSVTVVDIDSHADVIDPIYSHLLYSPNSGTLDLAFSANEALTVSVNIIRAKLANYKDTRPIRNEDLAQLDHGKYMQRFEKFTAYSEREVIVDLPILEGDNIVAWQGTDIDGGILSDGLYWLDYHFTDNCGHVKTFSHVIELDATAPEIVLLEPFAGQNVSIDMQALGMVKDQNFNYANLEFLPGTDLSSAHWNRFNVLNESTQGLLGVLNTFGLEGDYYIRVAAEDYATNYNELLVPITILPREELIESATLLLNTISPNNDDVAEELIVKLSLLSDANIEYQILDDNDQLVYQSTLELMNEGNHQLIWDTINNAGQQTQDGPYSIIIKATDVNNTSSIQEASLTLNIDSTLPLIDIGLPSTFTLTPETPVSVRIEDETLTNFIISIFRHADGEYTILEENTVDIYHLNYLENRNFEDGAYTLTAHAKDRGQNQSVFEQEIIMDSIAPVVELNGEGKAFFSPADELMNFSGVITEENLSEFAIYRTSEQQSSFDLDAADEIYQFVSPVAGPFDISLPITLANSGKQHFWFVARDAAGLAGWGGMLVELDDVPPTLSLTAPLANELIKPGVRIRGTAYDDNFDFYQISYRPVDPRISTEWVTITSSTRTKTNSTLFRWDLFPEDGEYELRIQASDVVGNTSVEIVHVRTDNLPPSAPNPFSAELVQLEGQTPYVQLTWESNDDSVAGFKVKRNGQFYAELSNDTFALQDADILGGETEFTYIVEAFDEAGWESPTSPIKIDVDLVGPEVSLTNPVSGSRVTGIISVTGKAHSYNDFKEYIVDWAPASDAMNWSQVFTSSLATASGELAQWDTFPHSLDEEVVVRLRAWDITGNLSETSTTIYVDSVPPAKPTGLSATSNANAINLTWNANSESDLAGYLLYRNDLPANGDVNDNVSDLIISTNGYDDVDLPDGAFAYKVAAIDSVGNVSEFSDLISESLDLNAPTASISSPVNAEIVGVDTVIVADSNDQDIAQVTFEYAADGSSSWQQIGIDSFAPFEVVWDNAALPFGVYQLRAVAADQGGLVDASPVAISVNFADIEAPDTTLSLETRVTGGDVLLTWAKNQAVDLAGYELFRATEGNVLELVTTLTTDDMSYNDVGLVDASYRYELVALDAAGNRSVPAIAGDVLITTPAVDPFDTPRITLDIDLTGQTIMPGDINASLNGSLISGVSRIDESRFTIPTQSLETGDNILQVYVLDAFGNQSKTAEYTIVVATVPSAPTNLAANINGEDVDLTWDANPVEENILGYLSHTGTEGITNYITANAVSASSNLYYENSSPDYVIDGDTASVWRPYVFSAEQVVGEWISLSFNESQLIKNIFIDWLNVEEKAAKYELTGRLNDDWFSLGVIESASELNDVLSLTIPVLVDEVKLTIDLPNHSQGSIQLSELRIEAAPELIDTNSLSLLLNDGHYQYTVSAVNQWWIEGPESEAINFAVGDVTPPNAVTLVASADGQTINASWNVPDIDIDRYELFNGAEMLVSTPSTTSQLVSQPNGQYSLHIIAIDNAGNESVPSNVVDVVIDIPVVHEDIIVSAQAPEGGASVDLAWNAVTSAGIVGYRVYRSIAGLEDYQLVATTTDSVWIDNTVTNGTQYEYQVVPLDSLDNEGTNSNVVEITPLDLLAPFTPVISVPVDLGEVMISESPTVSISGYAEPNASVFLRHNGDVTTDTIAASSPSSFKFSYGYVAQWNYINTSSTGKYIIEDGGNLTTVYDIENDTTVIYDNHRIPRWKPGSDIYTAIVNVEGVQTVIAVNAQTGVQNELVNDIDFTPYWSQLSATENTLWLLGQRDQESGLWKVDLDSGIWVLVNSIENLGSVDNKLISLSVDSSYLAVATSNQELALVNTTSGVRTNYSFQSHSLKWPLEWNHDNTVLLVESVSAGQSYAAIINPLTLQRDDIALNNVSDVTWHVHSNDLLVLANGGVSLFNTETSTSSPFNVSGGVFDFTYNNVLRIQPNGSILATPGDDLLLVKLPGYYHFSRVSLDIGNNIFSTFAMDDSFNTSNDSSPRSLSLIQSSLDDYSFDEETHQQYPVAPEMGESVNLSIDINHDVAFEAVPQVNVLVISPSGIATTLIDDAYIDALNGNENYSVQIATGELQEFGQYVVLYTVDPSNEIVESDEANNTFIYEFVVTDNASPLASLQLDKYSFGPNTNLAVTADVYYHNELLDGLVRLSLHASNGEVIHQFTDTNVVFDSRGVLKISENWPVENAFSGAYFARLTVLDANNELVILQEKAFEILGQFNLAAGLVVDPEVNVPNVVNTESHINYVSGNTVVSGATLQWELVDDAQQVVWDASRSIGAIVPSDTIRISDSIPTENIASGNYVVALSLFVDEEQLQRVEQPILLVDSPDVLSGSLALADAIVSQGVSVGVNINITNLNESAYQDVPYTLSLASSTLSEGIVLHSGSIDIESASSASANIEFESSEIPFGVYDVVLEIDDPVAGLDSELDRSYFEVADLNAPVITVISPTENSATKVIPRIVVDVIDLESRVENVAMQLDDSAWLNMRTITVGGVQYVGPSDVLSSGVHTVRFKATDTYGNEVISDRTSFVVDANPPIINVENIIHQQHYKNAVSPTVTITDDNLIESRLILNGDSFISGSAVNDDGDYLLFAAAEDVAGNTTQQHVAFVVDTTPPEISVENVENDAVFTEAITPSIVVSDENIDVVQITLNGEVFNLGESIDSSGAYHLMINAADIAGNTVSESRYFDVVLFDPQLPPTISVSGVENGGYYDVDELQVSIAVHDDDLMGFNVTLNSSNLGAITSLTVDAAGVYNLNVVANDAAGNSSSVDIAFNLKALPPQIISQPILIGNVGQQYVYPLTVEGTPALNVDILSGPSAMAFNPSNWSIEWLVDATGGDVVPVTIRLSNAWGQVDQQYNISVEAEINSPPVINANSVAISTTESKNWDPLVVDADGDSLQCSVAHSLPLTLVVNSCSSIDITTLNTQTAAYQFTLTAFDGAVQVSKEIELIVSDTLSRTNAGVIVLYEFDEGAGDLVKDTSGYGEPLDLTVRDESNVDWTANSSLVIESATIIDSSEAAVKVNDAISTSNEVTMEAWITPANNTQGGPARIINIAESQSSRNLMLGQELSGYHARMRTTSTGPNGVYPHVHSASGYLPGAHHVVYTRNSSGYGAIHVNGELITWTTVTGDMSNWDSQFKLALGNEYVSERPWLGEMHLIAIFDRALSAEEIQQNYQAGPNSTPVYNPNQRNNEGAVVLYEFSEANGSVVNDTSGFGEPLNLTIQDPANVSWMPNDALSIDSTTIIKSDGPATKLMTALQATQEITIEAWIDPDNLTQGATSLDGPARIVTFSQDHDFRNFSLGQQADTYHGRLRTTTNNVNGVYPYVLAPTASEPELSHVVYTRASDGRAYLYVDGQVANTGIIDGFFDNWDPDYHLALADEFIGARSWLGDYHLVAIYDRALTVDDVQRNFAAGP